jgi:hypothetical protein
MVSMGSRGGSHSFPARVHFEIAIKLNIKVFLGFCIHSVQESIVIIKNKNKKFDPMDHPKYLTL